MGRRMIECKTWKSFQVGQLNFRQRCLWIGLITAADDQGRGYAHPGILRGEIFPYDDITHDELQKDIDQLAELELIHLYENGNGAPLYQIVNWWKYQRPTWAWPSDLPAPEGWTDRERYRRGNEVIEDDWGDDGGFTQPQNGPTVGPQRAHGETSPSTSGSTSGSNSKEAQKAPIPFSELPKKKRSQIMFATLAKICNINWKTTTEEGAKGKAALNQSEAKLREAGAKPSDVEQFPEWWYEHDWRGRQGDTPLPHQVRQCWGDFEDWRDGDGQHKSTYDSLDFGD